MAERESSPQVLAIVKEEFDGQLHVLVNNSGAAGGGKIERYDMDEWDSTLNLNVTVPMYVTRQCMALLEAAGTHEDPASVIMVGSTDALKAPGGSSLGR
jgi:NADP-dependent 3-hydroxy acid dehydrogenase YdfG